MAWSRLCNLIIFSVCFSTSLSSYAPGGVAPVKCPADDIYQGFSCGRLEVPLDYHRPHGESISLFFTIVNGTIEGFKPQALTVIGGGPGGGSISSVLPFLRQGATSVLKQPSVILDARGTGLSQALVCPSFKLEGVKLDSASVKQCGIEVGPRRIYFNSANHARDLEVLRQRLSVGKWNMVGISAGTQVVIYSAFLFPKSSRTFLMDGAFLNNVPRRPGVEFYRRVKKTIYAACERSSQCSGDTYFNNLDIVLRSLRINPNEIATPYNLGPSITDIGGIGKFSKALSAAAKGNFTGLESIQRVQIAQTDEPSNPQEFSAALFLSTVCLEYGFPWSPYDDESAQLAKVEQRALSANPKDFTPFLPDEFLRFNADEIVCIGWPRVPFGVNLRKILPPLPRIIDTRGTPVLVAAGELDLSTSVEEGQEVAQKFNNVKFVQVGNTGHTVSTKSQCALDFELKFLLTAQLPSGDPCLNPASQPYSP